MTTAAMKKKLHYFVDTGDVKKVKALFTLLENDIENIAALNASIDRGIRDLEMGLGRSHEEVMADLRKRYNL